MLEIHLYVHGRGRGHASRAVGIIAALQARGHRVRAFAGGDAIGVLRPHVDTSVVASLPPRVGVTAIATLGRRVIADLVRNRATRPDVVVSDGDLPGLCAAHLSAIPTVAIGHGLVFLACRRPHRVPRLAWWRESFKAGIASIGAQRRVATHFTTLPLRRGDTVLARPPMQRWPLQAARDRIVAYFRDGICPDHVAAIRSVDPDAIIFSRGGGVGVREPSAPAFEAAIGSARLVVATAGSQLIAECVAHGLPLLALYGDDDDEQRLNATMLVSAGLGRAARLGAFSSLMLRETFASQRSIGLRALPEYDAAEAVVDACESLARCR